MTIRPARRMFAGAEYRGMAAAGILFPDLALPVAAMPG